MTHQHTCPDCGAVIAEGDFDCEFDRDHAFEDCEECAALAREEEEEAQLMAMIGPSRARCLAEAQSATREGKRVEYTHHVYLNREDEEVEEIEVRVFNVDTTHHTVLTLRL